MYFQLFLLILRQPKEGFGRHFELKSIQCSGVVYPNPTSNVVNVKSETLIISVQLIDFTGKVVANKQVNANNYKYDVSNLQAGIYTIVIVTADANIIEKLIVE